jgi:U3 small nucleolar RNA-associated protein 14
MLLVMSIVLSLAGYAHHLYVLIYSSHLFYLNFAQGSWGGTGTRRNPPKPYLIKKIPGIDPKSRADHNKSHVIISEKRDKKASKYLTKDLPYPYTSQAQFERSLDTPIGTEWNTRLGFQRGTLPKVVKKVKIFIIQPSSNLPLFQMGKIIDPLEKLF